MATPLALAILFGAVVLLAPDEPKETIVLLPDADGGIGKIAVNPGAEEIILDEAGETAFIGDEIETATLSDTDINALFSDVLAARPAPPVSFQLYFLEGSTDLVESSKADLQKIFAELERRPAPEISIIGHTDRAGSLTANDALALNRAQAIRLWLVDQGLSADLMDTAGRGEREPIIDTADGVAEPKNRRVEILVR